MTDNKTDKKVTLNIPNLVFIEVEDQTPGSVNSIDQQQQDDLQAHDNCAMRMLQVALGIIDAQVILDQFQETQDKTWDLDEEWERFRDILRAYRKFAKEIPNAPLEHWARLAAVCPHCHQNIYDHQLHAMLLTDDYTCGSCLRPIRVTSLHVYDNVQRWNIEHMPADYIDHHGDSMI